MVKVGKYASPMDPSWVYIDSRATFSVDLSNPSGRQNSGRSAQSDVSLSFGQVRSDFWWGVLVGWLVGWLVPKNAKTFRKKWDCHGIFVAPMRSNWQIILCPHA